MRRRRPERRQILPDPVYNDLQIAKFVNYLMKRGKKELLRKYFMMQWILYIKSQKQKVSKFLKKQ